MRVNVRYPQRHFLSAYRETIIIGILLVASILLMSPRFTSQMIGKPPDTIAVGMTTYFEDFYYYLDQFQQGKDGNWLTENKFSVERFPPTILYFNHILLGKIGGIFGLESYQSFNIFGLLFKGAFIFSCYLFLVLVFPDSLGKRVGTLLIFLFSTSFPNITVTNGIPILNPPIDIFRTANRALARFGTSPNGMLTNFLFVILLLWFIRLLQRELRAAVPKRIPLALTSAAHQFYPTAIMWFFAFSLLALGDITMAIVLCALFILLLMITEKSRKPSFWFTTETGLLGLCLCILVVVGVFLTRAVNNDPVYAAGNAWDINQYLHTVDWAGWITFLRGFGIQLPLSIIGTCMLIRKKRRTIQETGIVLVILICWIGYLVPLLLQIPFAGFRFLFPATYLFMSIAAMITLLWISTRSRNRHALLILLTIYLSINLPTYFLGWLGEFAPLKEPEHHFAYVPRELYDGFRYLRSAEPKDANVLASPDTSIDLMIPGLAGRYTYSGHFLTTYNAPIKDGSARKFFNEWLDTPGTPEAHRFLQENNIGFIVVTKYVCRLADIRANYPFLIPVFENPTVTIFRYEPPPSDPD